MAVGMNIAIVNEWTILKSLEKIFSETGIVSATYKVRLARQNKKRKGDKRWKRRKRN